MILADTHTHLYLNAFEEDRDEVIQHAIKENIELMLLPNIDSSSVKDLLALCDKFPLNCFPMMGLHPTSVKENYKEELENVSKWVKNKKFIAIGEIGIDLYWDKTFIEQQLKAFRYQIELALENDLPIAIHSRDSFAEIFEVLKNYKNSGLRGVFHCFTGDIVQAELAIDYGFYLGIGGVVTFKNSGLDKVIQQIDLNHILLETDAPFLAPVPFRGKRNESSYIQLIAGKISEIKNIDKSIVANITTQNTIDLFKLNNND